MSTCGRKYIHYAGLAAPKEPEQPMPVLSNLFFVLIWKILFFVFVFYRSSSVYSLLNSFVKLFMVISLIWLIACTLAKRYVSAPAHKPMPLLQAQHGATPKEADNRPNRHYSTSLIVLAPIIPPVIVAPSRQPAIRGNPNQKKRSSI